MNKVYSFKSFGINDPSFPLQDWNDVVGCKDIFLSYAFLQALQEGIPDNMTFSIVAFFKLDKLIGGAILQRFTFGNGKSFGAALNNTCNTRQWLMNQLGKHIHFLGNNMVSGEHAYYFNYEEIDRNQTNILLLEVLKHRDALSKKPSIIILKDVKGERLNEFKRDSYWKNFISFTAQPSMIFNIAGKWRNFDEYVMDLSTKYRTRIKAARGKLADIIIRELDVTECRMYEKQILELYRHVAEGADFNMFFLPFNHFTALKQHLNNKFRLFAYFLGSEMVGFYSVICNEKELDTYFLGYNPHIQKDRKLYLNFLLDMLTLGIEEGFECINFGRTAMEIKSTLGAKPVEIYGLLQHKNGLINGYLRLYFAKIYKQKKWIPRDPFRENIPIGKLEKATTSTNIY